MIGQGAMNYENEKAININSYFQVQNSQSSQNSLNFDADFVEQYLQENDISSQEIINGIPILESTETGLSQYLDNLDVKTEERVPDADIKPKAILTYSMVPKWDDVASLYQQTKSKATQITPDLTELPNTDFKLVLPQRTQSSKFHYSNDGQLFIKGDVQFHLDVSYKPVDDSVLFIRLMSVIPNNISKPVVRCENHASKDCISSNQKKYNVIHSNYPQVIYEGSKEGRSADERLSIVFPLPCSNNKRVGENIVETIPIMFVCQTSCIGRDDIAVICTLENSSEVLARTTMQVKICSCPKRDCQKKDEESGVPSRSNRKRPMQTQNPMSEGKRIKVEPLSQNTIQNDERSVLSFHFDAPNSYIGLKYYLHTRVFVKLELESDPENDYLKTKLSELNNKIIKLERELGLN